MKDLNSFLGEEDMARINLTQDERASILEFITTEISVYLGMIYHIVEVFKGHGDFADELSRPISST